MVSRLVSKQGTSRFERLILWRIRTGRERGVILFLDSDDSTIVPIVANGKTDL